VRPVGGLRRLDQPLAYPQVIVGFRGCLESEDSPPDGATTLTGRLLRQPRSLLKGEPRMENGERVTTRWRGGIGTVGRFKVRALVP
jgi:hypothetical protein